MTTLVAPSAARWTSLGLGGLRSLPLAMLAFVGFQVYALVRFDNWYFEVARAHAAAGQVLLLVGPVLTAAGAHEAHLMRRQLDPLRATLARWGRGPVAIWWRITAWLLVLQLLTVLVATAVAVMHRADWYLSATTVVVPFAAISGFVALGVAAGWMTGSAMAAPVLAVALLGVVILGPSLGWSIRDLLETGGSAQDLALIAPSLSGTVMRLALWCGLTAVVLAGLLASSLLRLAGRAVGVALVALALWIFQQGWPTYTVAPPDFAHCVPAGVTEVCGSGSYGSEGLGAVAAVMTKLQSALPPSAITSLPAKVVIYPLPLQETGLPVIVGLEGVDSAVLREGEELGNAVIRGLVVSEARCGFGTSSDEAYEARIVLGNYLAARIGLVPRGFDDPAGIGRLAAMTTWARDGWVTEVLAAIHDCRTGDIRLPR